MPSVTSPNGLTPARRDPRAAMMQKLNENREPLARVTFVESVPFGRIHHVERYRLGNGLSVLVLADPSAPVFSFHTWFAVGSRHEKPGKTGLAHLFEHLMFNETETMPAGAFDRKLEEAGAESNAATWVDWTYYYENLPKDRLGLVVTLESSRMSRLVLREPQVTSEKDVVANERRQRVDDDVDGAVSELLYQTAFTRHGYGWPTIGWMADIEAFTTDDCAAFYKTYYAPNNATIIVVGDVRPADVLKRIQDAYGMMAPADIPVEEVAPEPPQREERRLEVVKPTATEKLVMGYRGPALGDADHAAFCVLNEALFGGRASRAHRALVQESEVATEVRGWVSTFRDPGLYEVGATGRKGVTCEKLLEALDAVLEGVVREPLSVEELAKVKARLELAALQGLETASGKAEQIGFWEVTLGDPAGAFQRLAATLRVTRSDVLRAARRYLVNEGRSIVLVRAGVKSE